MDKIRCFNKEKNEVRWFTTIIVEMGSAEIQGYFPQPEPEIVESLREVKPDPKKKPTTKK